MKKKVVIAAFSMVIAATFAFAASGKSKFTSKGCTACHHPSKDQLAMGLGSSLKMISVKYKGDKAGLVAFLQGKGKPRVAPQGYPIMRGQLARLSGMGKSDLNAIADFILNR